MPEMADVDGEESHGSGIAAGVVSGALVIGGAAALAVGAAKVASVFWDDPKADDVSPELGEMNAADAKYLRTRPDPEARTRQRHILLLANSLDVATVATLLRESLDATEHRVTSRRLYAFESRIGWRVPAFQFVNGRVIPNLDRVTPHFRRDLHPLEVVNWFHRENPDLRLNDEAVSPAAWLQSGGDPSRAAKLAEALGRPI